MARGSERVVGSEHRRADRKQKVVGKSELVGVRGAIARLATRSWQAAATQQAAHVVGWLDAVREPPVLLDLGTHPTHGWVRCSHGERATLRRNSVLYTYLLTNELFLGERQ